MRADAGMRTWVRASRQGTGEFQLLRAETRWVPRTVQNGDRIRASARGTSTDQSRLAAAHL